MKKSEPPLWVEIKPSKHLLIFILSTHSLAIMSVWFLAILIPLKLLLTTLIFDSVYFYLRQYRKGFYQFTLKHSTHSSWQLIKNDRTQSMQILRTSVLTSFIIILHLKINHRSRNILILQDAISPEDYRRIFVALKITTPNKDT